MEEVQMFLDEGADQMDKALEHLGIVLSKIRAGKATPGMLDTLKVEKKGDLLLH